MVASLAAAVLSLSVLTVLPGPDVAVVTRVVIGDGRQAARGAAFGVVCGLLAWGALTVVGLAAVLAASAAAYAAVKIAGAAYLVALGVATLWRARRPAVAVPAVPDLRRRRHPWRVGFTSNILNPKIAVFYTSLLPQLVPAHTPHAVTLSALVLIHVALSLLWLTLYATIVDRASGVLTRPRVRQQLDRVTGLVLVGLGMRVAAAHREVVAG